MSAHEWGVCFCRTSSVVRRGDRFFPGTLFQDRLRRPAAGEAGMNSLEDFGSGNKHLLRKIDLIIRAQPLLYGSLKFYESVRILTLLYY